MYLVFRSMYLVYVVVGERCRGLKRKVVWLKDRVVVQKVKLGARGHLGMGKSCP